MSLPARKHSITLTLATLLFPLLFADTAYAGSDPLALQLGALEQSANGRIGLALIETGTGVEITYRGDERFPLASTFKALLAGAVLRKSVDQPGLLDKRISYSTASLVNYSPVTEKHLEGGMTIAQLCAAAIEWSDNTAANLLLREVGGPQAVTLMARALADPSTRLDRWEPELNTAVPGDPRDTSTPQAIARTFEKLVLGNQMPEAQRKQLVHWLVNSQTGAQSIRAAIAPGWVVGDKTGSGAYGTTNDLAVVWPPDGAPFVLAIYFTQPTQNAGARRDVLARAAELAIRALQNAKTPAP